MLLYTFVCKARASTTAKKQPKFVVIDEISTVTPETMELFSERIEQNQRRQKQQTFRDLLHGVTNIWVGDVCQLEKVGSVDQKETTNKE